MHEVKREELQEGKFYIIETIDDKPKVETHRLRVKHTTTYQNSTFIKILKIEEPFIAFANISYREKSYDKLENCKFYEPSADFLKIFQPKRRNVVDEDEDFDYFDR